MSTMKLSGGTTMNKLAEFLESYGVRIIIRCGNTKGKNDGTFGSHRLSEVSELSGGSMTLDSNMTVGDFIDDFKASFGEAPQCCFMKSDEELPNNWTISEVNQKAGPYLKEQEEARKKAAENKLKHEKDERILRTMREQRKDIVASKKAKYNHKPMPLPEEWGREYASLLAELERPEPDDVTLRNYLANSEDDVSFQNTWDEMKQLAKGDGSHEAIESRLSALKSCALNNKDYWKNPEVQKYLYNEIKSAKSDSRIMKGLFSVVGIVTIGIFVFIIYCFATCGAAEKDFNETCTTAIENGNYKEAAETIHKYIKENKDDMDGQQVKQYSIEAIDLAMKAGDVETAKSTYKDLIDAKFNKFDLTESSDKIVKYYVEKGQYKEAIEANNGSYNDEIIDSMLEKGMDSDVEKLIGKDISSGKKLIKYWCEHGKKKKAVTWIKTTYSSNDTGVFSSDDPETRKELMSIVNQY